MFNNKIYFLFIKFSIFLFLSLKIMIYPTFHATYITIIHMNKGICTFFNVPCKKHSSDWPSCLCWWACIWAARRSCRHVSHCYPSTLKRDTRAIHHGHRDDYIRIHFVPSCPSMQSTEICCLVLFLEFQWKMQQSNHYNDKLVIIFCIKTYNNVI